MSTTDPLPVRVRPEIAATAAYAQGRTPAPDGFKLSSNENPYPPLPGVLQAVAAAASSINRYPDAAATALRAVLAERFGVDVDGVHVGAGSVALLAQLISAAAGPGDEVVYAWRSFEAYPGLVTVAGATSVRVANLPDGRHDVPALAAAVTDRTRVLIVCSPNNPTGTIVTRAEFAQLMASVPKDVLVLLDEAYGEFVTDPDAVDGQQVLPRYPNLVALRTFSKAYGLAALRIGYAVGHPAILSAARSAAIPLSVTDAAQAAAAASIEMEEELMQRVARIALQRDRTRAALLEQGWRVPAAQGNFLWLATGEETNAAANAFFDAGLSVRPFHPEGIRVSIGEPESVEKLLKVAGEIVRTLPMGHPGKRLG